VTGASPSAAATSDGPPPSLIDAPGLARSTLSMAVLTVVSRVTGFVRVLVVASVLGVTFLGNTYQSSNSVPNILFELIAAGVLQAVLVPSLVPNLDRGDRAEAEHIAGSVMGLALAAMAAATVIGAVAAPWIAGALFSQSDPAVRDDQVRLGTIFLWIFLPQVLMYVVGMVATSVLNARNRFALPVFAPAVNNVVVTVGYGLFWLQQGGDEPTLDLSAPEIATLAGFTTLGVLAFCSLPYIAVVRSGFSLRPRFDHRHAEVRRIGRLGLWAALFLAVTQVLLVVVLVLANKVEGGVVAYQVGFTYFLLPHAVIALPILTALFPTLSRQAVATDWSGYRESIERGMRAIAVFVVPAATALVAVAPVLSRSLLFGKGEAGADQIARVIVGFALGLPAYGLFLFLSRVMYARGDTRTPALVNLGVAVAGAVAMVVAFSLVPDRFRVAALAAAHSAAYTGGAVVLYRLVRQRLPAAERPNVARSLAVALAAAVPSYLVMWGLARSISSDSRIVELAMMGGALALGGIVYLGATAALGGPRPGALVGMMRGGDRG
jgi:putative peptidoglycan lipid II flippase